MAKELMEIGGFITEGAEIVNHDNTLSGNGTVDSPLGVVPGYNETVLWEQTNTAYPAVTANATLSITLSEPISSFEKIKFEYRHSYWPSVLLDQGGWDSREAYVGSNMAYIVQTDDFGIKENSCNFQDRNSLLCSGTSAIIAGFGRQEINASGFSTTKRNDRGISPVRIVGINRKAQ